MTSFRPATSSLSARLLGRVILISFLAAAIVLARPVWYPGYIALAGGRTLQDAVEAYETDAEERLRPYLESAGFRNAPRELALLGFKTEERLELWARDTGPFRHVRDYPFTAMSGGSGPKLREGDGQIPEGVYRIVALNPNSSYHLSMKIDYPNAFDRRMAERDGRTRLGGDIFIHGKAASIGCIPVGDRAIEELFVLVTKTGRQHVNVIIAPEDFRRVPADTEGQRPRWIGELYSDITAALRRYPVAG